MKQRQIDLFFKILNKELQIAADVILVGASAGSLMGHVRPSFDIDFEIRLKRVRSPQAKAKLEASIKKAREIAGVSVNYSENVGGRSRISYLDYRKTAVPYKQIGRLNVKLIAPEYWTIGKMARFLELDIQDMVKIIQRKRLRAGVLVRIWARAIRSSDLSLELGQFRDHVIYFIKKYAKKLWGKNINSEKIIEDFKDRVGRKHFSQ